MSFIIVIWLYEMAKFSEKLEHYIDTYKYQESGHGSQQWWLLTKQKFNAAIYAGGQSGTKLPACTAACINYAAAIIIP